MRTTIGILAFATAATGLAGVALAQSGRDPAYQAARSAGQVGEQPDGYLGIAVAPTPALRAMVSDINIQRKKVYTQQATAEGSTVEQFAFVSGCRLILQTVAGEKYQTPGGAWETRGNGAPSRDSRCV
jgi:uncharacterized protein